MKYRIQQDANVYFDEMSPNFTQYFSGRPEGFLTAHVGNDGSMSFWRAQLQNGRFMQQQCTNCTRYVFYPRVQCPHCECETLHWDEALLAFKQHD